LMLIAYVDAGQATFHVEGIGHEDAGGVEGDDVVSAPAVAGLKAEVRAGPCWERLCGAASLSPANHEQECSNDWGPTRIHDNPHPPPSPTQLPEPGDDAEIPATFGATPASPFVLGRIRLAVPVRAAIPLFVLLSCCAPEIPDARLGDHGRRSRERHGTEAAN